MTSLRSLLVENSAEGLLLLLDEYLLPLLWIDDEADEEETDDEEDLETATVPDEDANAARL